MREFRDARICAGGAQQWASLPRTNPPLVLLSSIITGAAGFGLAIGHKVWPNSA